MEPKLLPKKRKQPSQSNPFVGIFTRSKSQIYIHRNRSGRSRSDSVRRQHHYTDQERYSSRNPQTYNEHENSNVDISHLSIIKDLRTRRVFSPASIIDECFPKESENQGKAEIKYVNSNLDCKKLSSHQNLNHSNPNLQSKMDHCDDDDDERLGENGERNKFEVVIELRDAKQEISKGVDEFIQMTPVINENGGGVRVENGEISKGIDECVRMMAPVMNENGDILKGIDECVHMMAPVMNENGEISKGTDECVHMAPVMNQNGGFRVENGEISKGIDEYVRMSPVINDIGGIKGENDESSNGSRGIKNVNISKDNESVGSRSKLVLKLCSGRKVFKTPSSFSYRRLVPFLMDNVKENSCNSFGASNEKFDSGLYCEVQNSNDMNPNLSSNVFDNLSGKCDDMGAFSDDRTPPKDGKYESVDMELPCGSKDLNGIKPDLTQTDGINGLHNTEDTNKRYADVSNGFDELMKECVQMTPPDADIFCRPEVNDSCDNKDDNGLQTKDHTLGEQLNGRTNDVFVDERFCADIDRNNSIPKSKLALNPCSRLKVFRTPSSFSYRRLLPFLMDNDFCAKKDSQCKKSQNILEDKPLQPVLPSLCQEVHEDASRKDSFSMVNHTSDPEPNLLAAISSPTKGSFNDELSLVYSENVNELQMPFDSQNKWTSQVEQVIVDRPRNADLAHSVSPLHEPTPPAVLLSTPVNFETSAQDGALEVSNVLTSFAGEESRVSRMEFSKDTKRTETVNLDQNLSQLETSVPSGIQADSVKKGILKTNPRGCRGLCNCLNCASFRLHADRAFEFSRNQMHDAEEVAIELIKELSDLRNMLEKSAVNADDHAVVHINQVKAACMKAFGAEEVARTRLSEMNYDLNIHCRTMCLQRPRVRFANYFEEKDVPKANL